MKEGVTEGETEGETEAETEGARETEGKTEGETKTQGETTLSPLKNTEQELILVLARTIMQIFLIRYKLKPLCNCDLYVRLTSFSHLTMAC